MHLYKGASTCARDIVSEWKERSRRGDLRRIRGEYQRGSVTHIRRYIRRHMRPRRSFKRIGKIARDCEARVRARVFPPVFSSCAYLPSAYYIHTYIRRVQRHRRKAGVIQCKQREAGTF